MTQIETLIRDPYAIYARHVLKLRPLDPIVPEADFPLRGTVIHKIFERFVKDWAEDQTRATKAHLMEIARRLIAENAPWPTIRALWLARIDRVADWFIATEHDRQALAVPSHFEAEGAISLTGPNFTLTARADRIDIAADGSARLYDYKSGAVPSKAQQTHFDKQLILEAAMIERGGFSPGLLPTTVSGAAYIGLGPSPEERAAALKDVPLADFWATFERFVADWQDPSQGYISRRATETMAFGGDYDHLARFGEWDITADPVPEDME